MGLPRTVALEALEAEVAEGLTYRVTALPSTSVPVDTLKVLLPLSKVLWPSPLLVTLMRVSPSSMELELFRLATSLPVTIPSTMTTPNLSSSMVVSFFFCTAVVLPSALKEKE